MSLKIGNYVIEADPRLNDLPFMATWIPMLTVLGTYLFVVKYWGPRFMEKRKAYDLRVFIACYNIFQVLACAIMIREYFLSGFKLEHMYKCSNPDFNESKRMLRSRNFMLWLKGIELIETVLFVLRKKQNQVSNLHVYHHISTFFLGWYFMKYVGGGMLQFSVVINNLVHIVMYFYYFLATLGPKLQTRLQSFKKFITTFQMVQFVMILINCGAAIAPGCANPKTVVFVTMYIPDVLLLFHMFYSFYKKAYQKKISSSKSSKTLKCN